MVIEVCNFHLHVMILAHTACNIRLGVKTRAFHLGDYRRATVGPGQDVPDDYFFVNGEDVSSLVGCRT